MSYISDRRPVVPPCPPLCSRSAHSSVAPLPHPQKTRAPLRDTSGTPNTRYSPTEACLRPLLLRTPHLPRDTSPRGCARAARDKGWFLQSACSYIVSDSA